MSFRSHLLAGFAFFAVSVPLGVHAQPRSPNAPAAAPAATQSVPRTAPVPDVGNVLTSSAMPALRHMMDSGVRLTSLGEIAQGSGIAGYLAESADGKFQTIYILPDGVTMMFGMAMQFSPGPMPTFSNITVNQLAQMRARLDAIRADAETQQRRAVELAESARRRAEEAATGNQDQILELSQRARQAEAARRQFDAGSAAAMPTMTPPPPPAPLPQPIVQAPLPQVIPPQAIPAQPVVAGQGISPVSRDEFLGGLDRNEAFWFDLGPPTAPIVVMVVDPDCPFCHEAWRMMRPMVQERRIRVRVVLIAGRPGSEANTISILARDRPGYAFWLGEGSTAGVPVAAPPAVGSADYAKGLENARMNMAFVSRFQSHITQTPFIAYEGADRRLRSINRVDGLEAFLTGMPTAQVPLPAPTLTPTPAPAAPRR